MDIIRGLIGISVLLFLSFLISTHKKNISWRLVISGILLQFLFAFAVLKVSFVKIGFEHVASFFVVVLDFTKAGSLFLFGDIVSNTKTFGFIFAFQVLPTIVFFSALTSFLYYLGILQKVVQGIAYVMSKTMRLSGTESLAAAANIFIGQTEAPLMIKPYLKDMSPSEILTLMTGGMATIAGGVFAAYIGFLGGEDEAQRQYFATHLLTASILSAPAAIVISKILLPETQKKIKSDQLKISNENKEDNILTAISKGTTEGLRLAVNVGAMLLTFTAFMYMFNYIIENWVGHTLGLNQWVQHTFEGRYQAFNMQFILGMLFSPLAWCIGTPTDDIFLVGQLLGEKTVLNEFFAYGTLGNLKAAHLFKHDKSILIATYALCGFSNFASIGIQIGGIGTLAPNQISVLSKLGIRALIGGSFACFLTAAIAGIMSAF